MLLSNTICRKVKTSGGRNGRPPTWSPLGDFRYKVIELRVVLTVYLIMGGHWTKSTKIKFCSPQRRLISFALQKPLIDIDCKICILISKNVRGDRPELRSNSI